QHRAALAHPHLAVLRAQFGEPRADAAEVRRLEAQKARERPLAGGLGGEALPKVERGSSHGVSKVKPQAAILDRMNQVRQPPDDCASSAASPDQTSHPTATRLTAAVIQNTDWKDCLIVLCRNCCWAISAPGQPPSKSARCRLLSGVRRAPRPAADLSDQYMR